MIRLATLAAVAALAGMTSAMSQDIPVTIEESLMRDRPYTLIYPETMQKIHSSSSEATLQQGTLQCDLKIDPAAPDAKPAEEAFKSFDKSAAETEQRKAFPDFAFSQLHLIKFQSGPAIIYSGTATGFDKTRLFIVQAEAVDQGRRYVFACIMPEQDWNQHEKVALFVIFNFSTRTGAKCCQ